MRIFALCTSNAEGPVSKALNVKPILSPPYILDEIDLQAAEGADLLYFRLHGIPNEKNVWYTINQLGNYVPAFSVSQLTAGDLDLSGAVVISGACYGLDSNFPSAFLSAGARAFIGGSGVNFAGVNRERIIGSDRLAMWVSRSLSIGLQPKKALYLARLILIPSIWKSTDRDAVFFEIRE